MKIFRAILIGALIWFFGVLSYLMVPSIPFFEDSGLQANSVLAIVILPLVWFGLSLYYKKGDATHGYEIGEAMLYLRSLRCFDNRSVHNYTRRW